MAGRRPSGQTSAERLAARLADIPSNTTRSVRPTEWPLGAPVTRLPGLRSRDRPMPGRPIGLPTAIGHQTQPRRTGRLAGGGAPTERRTGLRPARPRADRQSVAATASSTVV
ncbi:hypothetical protein ACFWMU_25715 [Streptomyces sp. NPDC058357]|uniref:hypothetical protein n=1 Tax=unclassified Streptomyces TaxID=2593676 RepID=UPI0036657B6E